MEIVNIVDTYRDKQVVFLCKIIENENGVIKFKLMEGVSDGCRSIFMDTVRHSIAESGYPVVRLYSIENDTPNLIYNRMSDMRADFGELGGEDTIAEVIVEVKPHFN